MKLVTINHTYVADPAVNSPLALAAVGLLSLGMAACRRRRRA